jgi:uncharacterized HAD superfamily protein
MDLDGVLTNVNPAILGQVSLDVAKPVTLANVTAWNWLAPLGLSEDYFLKTYCNQWEVYPLAAFIPYERHVAEYMTTLCEEHLVDIVTGHNESSRSAIAAWLKEYSIPYRKLIMHGCFVSKTELPYDIFVDDSPTFARKIAADPRGRILFLFDQPTYNHDVPDSPAVIRIHSIRDIPDHLKRHPD